MVRILSASCLYCHQATRGPQRSLLKSWLSIAKGRSRCDCGATGSPDKPPCNRLATLGSCVQDVVSRLAQDPCIGAALMQLIISQRAGREAAAAALAMLTSKSSSMAAAGTRVPQCQPALVCLLKHPTPATRLAACICLQNICSVADADDRGCGSSEVRRCSIDTKGLWLLSLSPFIT